MPFLLHKDDLLTEETAASDYQKWLDEDDAGAAQEDGGAPRLQQRNEPAKTPLHDERRFEAYG